MDTSGTKSPVAAPPKRRWRRHSDEFKTRVIELARQPNTSMAAVALANGLNANMLRRWVRDCEVAGNAANEQQPPSAQSLPAFVQLPMHPPPLPTTASSEESAAQVDVEIQRNGATVRARLPMDSRSAAWLREVTQ